jgi:hypothetical protein
MTINILRGKTTKKKKDGITPPDSIGEPDAHVFNCPKCARPLSDGTPKCPSCGQRLILGVALRRATLLAGFGLIIGVFAGAVLTSGVITSLLSTAAAAVASTVDSATPTAIPSAVPSEAPVATPTPIAEPAIPAAAFSALTQISILDTRIVSNANALAAAVSAKSTVELAKAMRALASDAANGSAQLTRLKAWSGAATVVAAREDFYDRVVKKALDSLRLSLTEGKAYRADARGMLRILKDLPGLDALSRGLAAAAEVELPPVDYGVLAE